MFSRRNQGKSPRMTEMSRFDSQLSVLQDRSQEMGVGVASGVTKLLHQSSGRRHLGLTCGGGVMRVFSDCDVVPRSIELLSAVIGFRQSPSGVRLVQRCGRLRWDAHDHSFTVSWNKAETQEDLRVVSCLSRVEHSRGFACTIKHWQRTGAGAVRSRTTRPALRSTL